MIADTVAYATVLDIHTVSKYPTTIYTICKDTIHVKYVHYVLKFIVLVVVNLRRKNCCVSTISIY